MTMDSGTLECELQYMLKREMERERLRLRIRVEVKPSRP